LCRYLLQQGYSHEGDLAIITPYVGQLQRLKKAVASSSMRVVLNDRDSEQLAEVEEAAAAAATEAAAAAEGAGAGGGGSSSSRVESASPVAAAGSSSVVEMGECVRMATIDNFQVWDHHKCLAPLITV
jgi:hypothetical protein